MSNKVMREMNFNNHVEVILTKRGAEIHNDYWAELNAKYNLGIEEKKEGDTHKEQMWSLFQTFGPQISMGLESPFAECKLLVECDS